MDSATTNAAKGHTRRDLRLAPSPRVECTSRRQHSPQKMARHYSLHAEGLVPPVLPAQLQRLCWTRLFTAPALREHPPSYPVKRQTHLIDTLASISCL
jgi:hypothetical protein